ncbi:hypothetical protein KI387_023265, partial [Taxus chinensis]
LLWIPNKNTTRSTQMKVEVTRLQHQLGAVRGQQKKPAPLLPPKRIRQQQKPMSTRPQQRSTPSSHRPTRPGQEKKWMRPRSAHQQSSSTFSKRPQYQA